VSPLFSRVMAVLKAIVGTICAAALTMLIIALAPDVPRALATAPATNADKDAELSLPAAEKSCAAFEVRFLDPTCRKPHAKKAARTKHQAGHAAR
jgi:hypothetical protein